MILFKIFIPLFLVIYLILISYPYFFSKINRFDSLGGLSVIDERSANVQRIPRPERTTDQLEIHLLKGYKIKAEFKSSEDNFGILLVKFIQLSAKVSDTVVFRIKEQGENNWYYEKEYKADQFQPNEYFTFGFPPISDSKNKNYVFETESLSGTYTNGVGLSPNKPQFALVYKYSLEELNNYEALSSFVLRKFYYVASNVNFLQNLQLLATLILFIFSVLFIMKKNQIKPSRITSFFLAQFKIPLLLAIVFFLLQAFISFNRFGVLSIVEEAPIDFKTDKQTVQLLEGQKISAAFKSTENDLGILFVKLVKFGMGTDQVVFRIKKEGDKKWHHEGLFLGSQIENNKYFPLGFPPIADSSNSVYLFEVEALAGNYTHGIGVTGDRQGLLLYKFSKGELTNYKTLSSFVFKKFIYVIKDVNYWQVAAVFVLSLLFALTIKKRNIKLLNFARLQDSRTRLQYALKINEVKSRYKSLEKGIIRLLNRWSHRLASTKIYLPFFDTNIKKRLAVGLLIFLLALLFKLSYSLVNQDKIFYYGLGGQGDYDQFIRAATCAVKSFCSYAILSQNFLIESSILGAFYEVFGFIGGLKAYLYLMVIFSSLVATLPYFLLSRKGWISIGGIMGSLFLATSDFLAHVSLNFPPDNGSTFTFSIFYILYLLSLYRGSLTNLFLLGFWGTIDGLNKALFLLNNPVALVLFAPAFFFEKAKKIAKFPFFRFNAKLLFYSALPFLVFLILYTGWEIFIDIKFSTPFWLRGLIASGGQSYTAYTSANDPSFLVGGVIFKLFYLVLSSVVMVKRVIQFMDINILFLIPIFLGMVIVSFKKEFLLRKVIAAFAFAAILTVLLLLFRENYFKIHDIFPDEYISQNWTTNTYLGIFLFFEILFLFILNFGFHGLKLTLPILTYVIMLIILTKNSPFPRIWTQVGVWAVILLTFIVDWLLLNLKNHSLTKTKILASLIILALFTYIALPKTIQLSQQLGAGIINSKNEAKYLKWASSVLPPNAVILGGGKSDLVALAENIKRPIVYNTLWSTALLIEPNKIPGISPQDFGLIRELKNEDNFKKKRYIILEDDVYLWRSRIMGVADNVFATSPNTLQAEDYSLKVYKNNPDLKKAIYELNFRDMVD